MLGAKAVNPKTSFTQDFILSEGAHLACVMETWLHEGRRVTLSQFGLLFPLGLLVPTATDAAMVRRSCVGLL